jgi:cytohesin
VTPLHAAAWNGQKEIAELLVSRGANLNTRSNWNDPILGNVIAAGWTELAEQMVARGAVLDIHAAAALGKREQVEAMLHADPGLIHARDAGDRTPLHLAVGQGHVGVAALLLQRGAEVNARAEGEFGKGMTPLHAAARGGQGTAAKLLLEHGADASARDSSGKRPGELAVDGGHPDVADLLRDHGGAEERGS